MSCCCGAATRGPNSAIHACASALCSPRRAACPRQYRCTCTAAVTRLRASPRAARSTLTASSSSSLRAYRHVYAWPTRPTARVCRAAQPCCYPPCTMVASRGEACGHVHALSTSRSMGPTTYTGRTQGNGEEGWPRTALLHACHPSPSTCLLSSAPVRLPASWSPVVAPTLRERPERVLRPPTHGTGTHPPPSNPDQGFVFGPAPCLLLARGPTEAPQPRPLAESHRHWRKAGGGPGSGAEAPPTPVTLAPSSSSLGLLLLLYLGRTVHTGTLFGVPCAQ